MNLSELKLKPATELVEIAQKIVDMREEIRGLYETDPGNEDLSEKQDALRDLEAELAEKQGDEPLIQVAVDHALALAQQPFAQSRLQQCKPIKRLLKRGFGVLGVG